MSIFKSAKLDWWEIGVIRLAVLYLGIVIGAYWYTIWMPYLTWLLVIGLVLGFYILINWIRD